MKVAVDFDGSLVETVAPLRWRPGALEAIVRLHQEGHLLVLHSCRCNPVDISPLADIDAVEFYRTGAVSPGVMAQWERFDEMRRFLQEQRAWYLFAEIWQSPGKPIADLYLDDRSEFPDWSSVAGSFGLRSMHA